MEPLVKDKPVSPRRVWPYLLGACLVLVSLAAFMILRNYKTRSLVTGFVADPAVNLLSSDGRTNLVFLGLGGEGHQAPDLTDSMILVSLRHSDSSISLVSVPRDLWVDTLKAKINTAYHYGNSRREGGGRDLAKSAVAEVLGVPVHYAVALDFDGFIKAIDAVGGIEVDVERTFDDSQYPIPGKETAEPESARYETLHFDAGRQPMDGVTALKFTRSRHAEGDEGTDFARSARQQKIIMAFKDKLFQTQTLLNKDRLQAVIGSFQSSLDTDIPESDYGSFLRFFLTFEQAGSVTKSISIDEFLLNPKNKAPYQGQWVLVPARDWQELHTYVKQSLE